MLDESIFQGMLLGSFIGFCSCCMPNDIGDQEYGTKSICISTDFSTHEQAIIENSVRIWNFDSTHFIFGCGPNSIVVHKDTEEHMNKMHGRGGTAGLSRFAQKEILVADNLDGDRLLAWVSLHESGHFLWLPDLPSNKPAIMNGVLRADVLDDLRIRELDMVEYRKVWGW